MLKIKDDVDLKVLEKFNFEDGGWSFRGGYIGKEYIKQNFCKEENNWCFNTSIRINKTTRKINFGINVPTTILFDLIQAGLVEKV